MVEEGPRARLSMGIERLFDSWPDLWRDLVVAFAAIAVAVGLRLALEGIVSGVVPFALTFPAVIAAGLVAGLRAGLIAIIGCQLLVWYYVLPPEDSFAILNSAQVVNLLLTTVAQLASVLAVSAYRRAASKLRDESGRREHLLTLALREIDHRTKNNFQIAASLLHTQAADAGSPETGEQLRLAASRLATIAGTYKNLSINRETLTDVRIDEHLRDLCDRLRAGMLPAGTRLSLEAFPLVVSADAAVTVGLIVNEWITNAAKHACPEQGGEILVSLSRAEDTITVRVSDNGGKATRGKPRTPGRGTDLVALLAQSIEAEIAYERSAGFICTLRFCPVRS